MYVQPPLGGTGWKFVPVFAFACSNTTVFPGKNSRKQLYHVENRNYHKLSLPDVSSSMKMNTEL